MTVAHSARSHWEAPRRVLPAVIIRSSCPRGMSSTTVELVTHPLEAGSASPSTSLRTRAPRAMVPADPPSPVGTDLRGLLLRTRPDEPDRIGGLPKRRHQPVPDPLAVRPVQHPDRRYGHRLTGCELRGAPQRRVECSQVCIGESVPLGLVPGDAGLVGAAETDEQLGSGRVPPGVVAQPGDRVDRDQARVGAVPLRDREALPRRTTSVGSTVSRTSYQEMIAFQSVSAYVGAME